MMKTRVAAGSPARGSHMRHVRSESAPPMATAFSR